MASESDYYILRLEHPIKQEEDVRRLIDASDLLPLIPATNEDEEEDFDDGYEDEDDAEDLSQEEEATVSTDSTLTSAIDSNGAPKLPSAPATTWVVRLTAAQIKLLLPKLKEEFPSFRAVTLRISTARHKSLAERPFADPTSTAKLDFAPATVFPMWYFFYGTLCDAKVIKRVLGLDNDHVPKYSRASIRGFRMASIGQYNALIEAGETKEGSKIDGKAYLVESEDHADKLATFETSMYVSIDVVIDLAEGRSSAGLSSKHKTHKTVLVRNGF